MASAKGRDWGEGLFKLTACEFCDDVLAECADIAIGDAWLPEFVSDFRGTNIAVVRHPRLLEIVQDGQANAALTVMQVTVDAVAESQSSGLRHRREGLAHRLERRRKAGKLVPRKRVTPALAPTALRQTLYDLRLEVAELSNLAFSRAVAANDVRVFEREIGPLIARLRTATRGTFLQRAVRKMGRLITRFVQRSPA